MSYIRQFSRLGGVVDRLVSIVLDGSIASSAEGGDLIRTLVVDRELVECCEVGRPLPTHLKRGLAPFANNVGMVVNY